MEIKLRDYQQKAYDETLKAFKEGNKGVCVVLPCRSGKSFVMAKMAQSSASKNKKVLILAHRINLLGQHEELFKKLNLDTENIRINSVFTEVNHLGEYGDVDFIIIDERTSKWCKFIFKSM